MIIKCRCNMFKRLYVGMTTVAKFAYAKVTTVVNFAYAKVTSLPFSDDSSHVKVTTATHFQMTTHVKVTTVWKCSVLIKLIPVILLLDKITNSNFLLLLDVIIYENLSGKRYFRVNSSEFFSFERVYVCARASV